MRPFDKTTATLVRPNPFSTLCPTPIGNSPVCNPGGQPAWETMQTHALAVRASHWMTAFFVA